jgi:hypothetical protein
LSASIRFFIHEFETNSKGNCCWCCRHFDWLIDCLFWKLRDGTLVFKFSIYIFWKFKSFFFIFCKKLILLY